MDAVVIVDPVQYQRRRVPVTFLAYPPDDLVLVVKIQWLGG